MDKQEITDVKNKIVSNLSQKWQQPRWRRFGIGLALLFLFLIIHHFKNSLTNSGKKNKNNGIAVSVATAQSGDMPIYLDGLGTVTAYYSVTVHTRVDGQLMSVAFTEGQNVHIGDTLAIIDPRPYQAQLDQAQGQLEKDQASLADAQLDLQRYKGLLAQQAIPKQQLDTQVALVGQDEGLVKTDEANIEAAKLQLIYTQITSPINGRVGLRLVDPGNIVHAADTNGLLVIEQLQPIAVIFTIPEDSIPKVMQRLNVNAQLTVDAYNRDKTQKLATGKLLTVDNQIDPTTGTLKLKAIFDNTDNMLFPNQFVNARLLLEVKPNQIIIPSVAIQRGVQGTFVYAVTDKNTVDMQPVKVGLIEGNNASIDTGVTVGESVVIDGADKLQPGSMVNIQPTTNPAATKGSSFVESGSKGKENITPDTPNKSQINIPNNQPPPAPSMKPQSSAAVDLKAGENNVMSTPVKLQAASNAQPSNNSAPGNGTTAPSGVKQ